MQLLLLVEYYLLLYTLIMTEIWNKQKKKKINIFNILIFLIRYGIQIEIENESGRCTYQSFSCLKQARFPPRWVL